MGLVMMVGNELTWSSGIGDDGNLVVDDTDNDDDAVCGVGTGSNATRSPV